jgi:small redox-active disulfide protein 2
MKSMTIKILGSGCMNCKTLERRTREAVEQLSLDAVVQKVEDYQGILSYGILSTPGLVIDEKVVSQGRVPTVETIKELIRQSQR